MDSEQSAFVTAQQKHHRYMIFGKKQRYIEVFQCSGEDMNLVLTGGIPNPVPPVKAAPALLSPGMLSTIAPLPPTNIPPPPPPTTMSQNLVAAPTWDSPTLLAQQQAQMIAQQNLLARQNQAHAQNEIMLMNQITQHNLAVLNQSPDVTKPSPYLPLLPSQPPFVLLPPRMTPLGMSRPQVAYPPHLLQASGPGMLPCVPHVTVKRNYSDAFAEQGIPAKRPYQGPVPVSYTTFYPNI